MVIGIVGLTRKQAFHTLFALLITVILFLWIFKRYPIQLNLKILRTIDFFYLSLSILILLLTISFFILRWYAIMKALNKKISMRKAYLSFMSALPLNSIVPSKIGDLGKAIYLREYGIAKVFGAVVAERFLDILVLLCFLMVSIGYLEAFLLKILAIISFLGLVCILVVLFLFAEYFKSIKIKYLSNLSLALITIVKNKVVCMKTILYTLLAWICSLIQLYLIFVSLGIKVSLIEFIQKITIVIFIGMLPITISGMGSRDAAIIAFFNQYASETTLLVAGLLFTIGRYWIPAIIGIPYLHLLTTKPKKRQKKMKL